MMVASGALQTIPEELYEAAVIDGATPMQLHWKITLPLIRPAMIPSTVLGIIWTFNNFLAVYLITGGGPNHKTEILLTYIYRIAFLGNGFLYSTASCALWVLMRKLIVNLLLCFRRLHENPLEIDRCRLFEFLWMKLLVLIHIGVANSDAFSNQVVLA